MLRSRSPSSISARLLPHAHDDASAKSSRTLARDVDAQRAASILASRASRNTRSTGGRASQRSAGNPPGREWWRCQRARSASLTETGCDAIEIPCRSSEAKNPCGENRALISRSLAAGQSPT
jgi:hypothetical protein